MLTQHIAIVPETDALSLSELARVSAAIQKQVTRDFSPIWSLHATVDVFPRLEDVPVGYWPVLIEPAQAGGEASVYLDERGQPYARVPTTPGSLAWSVAASRVCLEMLVNPYGERTVTAPSVRSDQGLVEVWLDVCGPCADESHAYAVNDVLVADFCTPAFFGQVASRGMDRCSFRGALPFPLHVPRGGHLAWYDPVSDAHWLRHHWGDNPVDMQWEGFDKHTRPRDWVRQCRALQGAPTTLGLASDGLAPRPRRPVAVLASEVRARRLRTLLSPQTMATAFGDSLEGGAAAADRKAAPSTYEMVDEEELRPEVRRELPDLSESSPTPEPAPSSDPFVGQAALEPARFDVEATFGASPAASVSSPAASASPHSTLAPVAVAAPRSPDSAPRHGLSLLGGAVAGAALVALLWGRQDSVARSEALSAPVFAPRALAAPSEAGPSPLLAASPPIAAPSAARVDKPLSQAPKPASQAEATKTQKARRRAKDVVAAGAVARDGGVSALPSSSEPSLEALVDTRE